MSDKDTIYRQDAIDALYQLIEARREWLTDARAEIAGIDAAICEVADLPSAQPEQRWIPVSERLPDEYEYVLLCDIEPDEDTGYSRMAVGWLEDGKICCWDDRATREEFVAWMPLPEPYQEGKQDE